MGEWDGVCPLSHTHSCSLFLCFLFTCQLFALSTGQMEGQLVTAAIDMPHSLPFFLSVSLSHFVALISMIFDSQMYKSLSFILLSGLFHLYWLEMCDYDILRWCFNTICCPIIILSFKLNLTWWTSFVCRVLYFIACICLSCRFHRLSGQPASHRSGPAWSCDL